MASSPPTTMASNTSMSSNAQPQPQHNQQQQVLLAQIPLEDQQQQLNSAISASSKASTMSSSGGGNSVIRSISVPVSGSPQQQQHQQIQQQQQQQQQQGMLLSNLNSTTLEQFVQTFNSQNEDGERIIEVSPNGRYAKLNVILGKGAYKVVYKAIDREEGYEVAWNCFQTTRAEFNELSQEIEILKRVRHPNIINFHDCWYNNVEFVFVTELMTSGTLREYIRKLQIPNMKIVKRWCRQILKGLLYLHSHNPCIIHRDIKCDNIFINGAHGEVKIGDMGTAKMKFGKKYTVIGTPEFMAPEMYEERGYSETVDVYAFGMCLLEMVTGEYPYSECTNAAQVYKKVSQGIKPDCLSRVKDQEVYDLIIKCLALENERWTVAQVLEHSFLSVEPEVVMLAHNENKTHLTLQVVFRGTDKLSVKFEFNTETDTAEEVVNEMIEETVLPQRYQQLITHEINKILRDLNKLQAAQSDQAKEEKRAWKRSDHMMKDELEEAKRQVQLANERALEAEKKAELSEVRARLAEEKSNQQQQNQQQQHTPYSASVPVFSPSIESVASTPALGSTMPAGMSIQEAVIKGASDEASIAQQQAAMMMVSVMQKEFKDDQNIEELVKEVATVTNRGMDKAMEWLQRLHAQDIMTVGDLRDLHDEDWASLGLTVFASRALRNALHGKQGRPNASSSNSGGGGGGNNQNSSPKGVTRSTVTTPPTANAQDFPMSLAGDNIVGIGISRLQSPPAELQSFQFPPFSSSTSSTQ